MITTPATADIWMDGGSQKITEAYSEDGPHKPLIEGWLPASIRSISRQFSAEGWLETTKDKCGGSKSR